MINTHIHIDFNRVKRSHLSAQTIIVPSVGKENWDKVCNYQHYALGIHPWYIEKHSDSDLKLLENIIKRKKPIAIGECGLDFSLKRKLSRKNQLHFFKHQIELALMFDLPLIIHSVKSNNEVIENLKTRKNFGVIHGFYGSQEEMIKFISMGFFIGIGHSILQDNFKKMKSIVQSCPLDRILIETDDKDPENLSKIALRVSLIKGLSYDETVLACDRNAKKLFGI